MNDKSSPMKIMHIINYWLEINKVQTNLLIFQCLFNVFLEYNVKKYENINKIKNTFVVSRRKLFGIFLKATFFFDVLK